MMPPLLNSFSSLLSFSFFKLHPHLIKYSQRSAPSYIFFRDKLAFDRLYILATSVFVAQ